MSTLSSERAEPVFLTNSRRSGESRDTQIDGVDTALPFGRSRKRLSVAEWTWYGSFPETIRAPPVIVQPLRMLSKEPYGPRK